MPINFSWFLSSGNSKLDKLKGHNPSGINWWVISINGWGTVIPFSPSYSTFSPDIIFLFMISISLRSTIPSRPLSIRKNCWGAIILDWLMRITPLEMCSCIFVRNFRLWDPFERLCRSLGITTGDSPRLSLKLGWEWRNCVFLRTRLERQGRWLKVF